MEKYSSDELVDYSDSADQYSSFTTPSTSFATTSFPIICLIDWNSPKCRDQMFELPAPRFAQNVHHSIAAGSPSAANKWLLPPPSKDRWSQQQQQMVVVGKNERSSKGDGYHFLSLFIV
jgi:hypothetical protein